MRCGSPGSRATRSRPARSGLPRVAVLVPAGLRHDRELAVVVGDEIVTQREHAALARVRPRLDDDTSRLVLGLDGAGEDAGNLSEVDAAVSADGPTRTVTISTGRWRWSSSTRSSPAGLRSCCRSTRGS